MATSTEHFTSGSQLTYGECLEPAMLITDQADASNYLDAYVRYLTGYGHSEDKAREIALVNIGYYAGYFKPDVQMRVQRMFRAAHPIFGALPDGEVQS